MISPLPRAVGLAGASASLIAVLLALSSTIVAEELPWAPWVEPDFPFFSSALDLRPESPDSKPWNITPRGIVLNLGSDCWACFDTDLLRVSAIWMGKGVTEDSLAPLSYQNKPLKTVGGQSRVPRPAGTVWLINGIYPGWQTGENVSLEDPREPQPSAEEPGRGPLPPRVGQFRAVHLCGCQAILEYTVAGAQVEECMTAAHREGRPLVERHIHLAPNSVPVTLMVGRKAPTLSGATMHSPPLIEDHGVLVLRIPAHTVPLDYTISINAQGAGLVKDAFTMPRADHPSIQRWPQEVVTQATLSTSKDAYVVDDIALPLENPWRRNVRLCDIAFFPDGRAAGVTVDGDVWIVHGLRENLQGGIQWRRFASGLHEPMGIAIRDGQIYVFDRNGIWRLRDTNGDGQADVHELFSNVFPQSAESREFPNSLKLAPDGSFIIAKGGQQASTISKLNGSVLRVAPNGQSYEILGVGFRQPFAGVNPRTGEVTASDQEGNYVPTTPLYFVKSGEYHGFLSEILPKEKYPAPIAAPLTWIPHPINPSAASQVWLYGAHMGPLNDSLISVSFNRPELFRVLLNDRFPRRQAAVVSVVHDFDVPTLNAAVNPADGFLYVTGFQVIGWGTTATRVSGLARVRYTGAPCTLPREVVPMDSGVLVRFDVPLDPVKALDLGNYTVESWHYRRTYKYGSPHLKADGTPGQDWIAPSSVYLAQDHKSIFLGVPGMKPVEQMRVGWALTAADGTPVQDNAFFTPYEMARFSPGAEGFGDIAVDLTPKAAVAQAAVTPTAEEGKRLYQLMGCMACHAIDKTDQPKIGPTWKGLYGRNRQFANGPDVVANDAYIRESILIPSAKIVKGYEKVEAGMPIYSGVLTDSQIESIILFIKTLR